MTDVTCPTVGTLPIVLRFWIDANPLPERPGIDLKYFIRVSSSRQYSSRILSVPSQPILPLAKGPAGNLTAKFIEMFHLFFSVSYSISTSRASMDPTHSQTVVPARCS